MSINRRRLKALSNRLTNKQIADILGVSTSTVYRIKAGKSKSPKHADLLNKRIDDTWKQVKGIAPNQDIKHKRELGETVWKERHFEYAKSTHFIYHYSPDFDTDDLQNDVSEAQETGDPSDIEGVLSPLMAGLDDRIKDINQLHFHPDNCFMITVCGIDGETGQKRYFSTKLAPWDELDLLYSYLGQLMGRPSKQLKTITGFEITLKQFD